MGDQTKTYQVLATLRHDGKVYGPNIEGMDSVELTPKQAAPLEKINVVFLDEDGDEADVVPSDDERSFAIVEVFQLMDVEKDFTKAGDPKAKVVNDFLDFDVTADEIKAAWANYQDNQKDKE